MAHIKEVTTQRGGTAYDVIWLDPEGNKRQKRFYGKKLAKDHKSKVEADKARGTYVDDRKGRTPFSEVAEEWLSSLTGAKPGTVAEYRRLLTKHALPVFGSRRVDSIKRKDVTDFVNGLAAPQPAEPGDSRGNPRSLRPQTISRTFHPLRATLRYAAREGYIPRSPANNIELPDDETLGFEPHAARFLSWPEVEAVAREAKQRHPHGELIIKFDALTGLRASEVAGLNVADVDTDKGLVFVRRTRKLKKGKWITGAPKTKRSRRTVPILDPDLTADLHTYLKNHPRANDPAAPLFYGRKRGGDHSTRRANPLAGMDPTHSLSMETFYKHIFTPAIKAAGLPRTRFHDLRHTFASLCASAGIDIRKVSRWMGHANVSITDGIYTHMGLWPEEIEADATRLGLTLTAQRDAQVIPLRRAQ